MPQPISRRDFLARSGVIGCSLAASPLLTPVSFASAPWDTRLVVIILRGGMDGLDVVQPYGDPGFAGLRGSLALDPSEEAYDLDGYFAMHPGLAPLIPMWKAGHLSFVHAVSTPYRDKRSHFDGQDLLEAGTTSLAGVRDGWLNRMLQAVPGVTGQTAYAIGRGDMRLMQGAAEVANWSPDADFDLSPQAVRLLELVTQSDPALHAALAEAQVLSEMTGDRQGRPAGDHLEIAKFAAARLSEDARIAAFSINGWDMHRAQDRLMGRALNRLSETLLTLQDKMRGDAWHKTAVVAMTEFGRTARQNGSGGTDHGTGGLMILAGGAIKGGRVFGQWPRLGDGDLYQDRDLMPTGDVRAHAAWIMRSLTGLDRHVLEGAVFPGLDMGSDPGVML
ncbi:DUF1501 domain-containing protein [uncultured Tateyamaria sp.]|uniref:DUF1501 domain-containing protein n=1 Tax=uncultured Tateyamaria sp. TaxID=455651 RepID=UPI0026136704|nr:DUF1501 domain-containing protein [uncultured Tateyamaria sp.]